MLLSYLQGKEYNEFTKNVEGIYIHIDKLEKQFYKLLDNEKVDLLTRIAYVTKRDIIDKIRKNRWSLDKPIYIQKLNGKSSLQFAYAETVGKIAELSKTLKDYFYITDILENEDFYNEWKEIYFHLDDENGIIRRYPNLIGHLASDAVAYVRRAGIEYFTVYSRNDRRIGIYTLTEFKDTIKVRVRCEDISGINRESELVFNLNTDEYTIATKCEKVIFSLYEKVIDDLF